MTEGYDDYLVAYNIIEKNGATIVSRDFMTAPGGAKITRNRIMLWEQQIVKEWRPEIPEIGVVRILNFQRIDPS